MTNYYIMLLRNRKTGREEILYGRTTENVIQKFSCPNLDNPRFTDGEWDLVIRPWVGYHCDWSECPGNHPSEENYCSFKTRYYNESI